MSYILEALKKSDRNRKREEIPDLSSDHSFSSPRQEERSIPVWKKSHVLILLFVAILTIVWGLDLNRSSEESTEKIDSVVDNTPAPASTPAPPSTSISAPTPAPASAPVPVPEKAVVITPERKVKIEQEVPKAISQIQSPPEPEEEQASVEEVVLPLMEDLPSEIKTAIPDLTFAGHVYAARSEQRMIMINMRVVREGDAISSDLILQEIEEDGVVLRYQDVPFRVRLF